MTEEMTSEEWCEQVTGHMRDKVGDRGEPKLTPDAKRQEDADEQSKWIFKVASIQSVRASMVATEAFAELLNAFASNIANRLRSGENVRAIIHDLEGQRDETTSVVVDSPLADEPVSDKQFARG